MTRQHSPILRTASAFVLAIFLAQEISAAAPMEMLSADIVKNPSSIQVSGQAARIEEVYRGSSDRLLVHIQDAHANLSGQENLAKVLEDLVRRYQLSTVFVEGAGGDMSLDFLRSTASAEVRQRVARKYLVKGELNGEEYLSLSTDLPLDLWGVEDAELYERNLRAYGDVVARREGILSYLEEGRKRISSLKRRLFPKEVLEFDETLRLFERKEKDFTEYHRALTQAAARYGVDLAAYPNFSALAGLKAKEEKVDFAKANAEQERLVSSLFADDASRQDAILHLDGALKTIKSESHSPLSFYRSLMEQASQKGLSRSEYPNILLYMEYLADYARVDMPALIREMDRLEENVFRTALPDAEAYYLHEISEHMGDLERLFSLQAEREDVERYRLRRSEPRFDPAVYLAFLNKKLYDLGNYGDLIAFEPVVADNIQRVEDFYRMTEERDEAFLANAFAKMDGEHARAAVLITGGYHTANLKRMLRSRGVSYVVITPNVTQETNLKRYEEILLGQLGDESPLSPATRIVSARRETQETIRYAWYRPNTPVARIAEDLGQDVGALPGPVRELIGTGKTDGARLALNASDEVMKRIERDLVDLLANPSMDSISIGSMLEYYFDEGQRDKAKPLLIKLLTDKGFTRVRLTDRFNLPGRQGARLSFEKALEKVDELVRSQSALDPEELRARMALSPMSFFLYKHTIVDTLRKAIDAYRASGDKEAIRRVVLGNWQRLYMGEILERTRNGEYISAITDRSMAEAFYGAVDRTGDRDEAALMYGVLSQARESLVAEAPAGPLEQAAASAQQLLSAVTTFQTEFRVGTERPTGLDRLGLARDTFDRLSGAIISLEEPLLGFFLSAKDTKEAVRYESLLSGAITTFNREIAPLYAELSQQGNEEGLSAVLALSHSVQVLSTIVAGAVQEVADRGARLAERPLSVHAELSSVHKIVRNFPRTGPSEFQEIQALLTALYGGSTQYYALRPGAGPYDGEGVWEQERHDNLSGLDALAKRATNGQKNRIEQYRRQALARLAELGIQPEHAEDLAINPRYQNSFLHTFLGVPGEEAEKTPGRLQRAAKGLSLDQTDVKYLRHFDHIFEVPMEGIAGPEGTEVMHFALRVQHNAARGIPYKGGLRWVYARMLTGDAEFMERFEELAKKGYSLAELRYFLRKWVQEETMALAFGMTVKSATTKLPYGGAKGSMLMAGIYDDGTGKFVIRDHSADPRFRDRMIRTYARGLFLAGKIGGHIDVPAPDAGSRPEDMALMTDELLKILYEHLSNVYKGTALTSLNELFGGLPEDTISTPAYLQRLMARLDALRADGAPVPTWLKPFAEAAATFTAKPIALGGSAFRDEATGYGVVHVLKEVLALQGVKSLKGRTAKVMGYGNVAQGAVDRLVAEGAKVEIISEGPRGIVYKPGGFTADDIVRMKLMKSDLGGFLILGKPADPNFGKYSIPGATLINSDQFLGTQTDFYIPAAAENTVTERDAKLLKTSIIAEGANGAVANGVEAALNKAGITVIPDSLANAGGVDTSYEEWVQNLANERWTSDAVAARVYQRLSEATQTIAKARKSGQTWRDALDQVALDRVLKARDSEKGARLSTRIADAYDVEIPLEHYLLPWQDQALLMRLTEEENEYGRGRLVYDLYLQELRIGKVRVDLPTEAPIETRQVRPELVEVRVDRNQLVLPQQADPLEVFVTSLVASDYIVNLIPFDPGKGGRGTGAGARLAQPAFVPTARQDFPSIITDLLGSRRDEVARLAESYRTAPDAPAREAVAKQIAKVVDEINVLQHPSGKTDADLEIVGPDFFVDDFVRTPEYDKYKRELEDRVLAGEYVPQFIFAGAATRLLKDVETVLGRRVDPLPYRMYGLDIWQALRIVQQLPDADLLKVLGSQPAVEALKQFQLPQDHRPLGLGPRQLLAYKTFLTNLAAERGEDLNEVLARQRLVLNINEEVADQVLQDFEDNNFYGFDRSKVFFIVQPVFEGFELAADGSVNPAPASPALPFGHGYATTQLNYPGDAFVLAADGSVVPVADSTLKSLIDADPGSRFITSTHRINDLTKVDPDNVVDVDALALGLYLQVEKGYRYITHLVGNPGKQKGGNNGRYKGDTRSFLVETSNTNGSPVLTALIAAAAQAGSPYNAFRNQSTPRVLQELLDIGIRYNLRFKDGFFYLESVTGDLSQIPQSNTASIHRRGELIKDFKQLTNLAEALPFLAKQDAPARAAKPASAFLQRLDGDDRYGRYRNYDVKETRSLADILEAVRKDQPGYSVVGILARPSDDKRSFSLDLTRVPFITVEAGTLLTISFVIDSVTPDGARLADFKQVPVPANFTPAITRSPFNLIPEKVEVLQLKGDAADLDAVLADRTRSFAVAASIGQALGSIIYAGQGKGVKEVADGNAVHFTEQSIRAFTQANPNTAVVILADEGGRDLSYSLAVGSVYFNEFPGKKSDFVGLSSLYAELQKLRDRGVEIYYFVGDALEKTNGLVIPEATSQATDSISLFGLFKDEPGAQLDGLNRFLINDNFRIGGVSYSAPDTAGVTPFDLPSQALPKIARSNALAQGLTEGTAPFDAFVSDYINATTVLALGPRAADLKKDYETAVGGHRHQRIISDASELKKTYPGLKIVLPGDGDFGPRLVATLGLDLDGRHLVVFGRSGSAEATGSTIAGLNLRDSQFAHTFVSSTATSGLFAPETAYQYNAEEGGQYADFGIARQVYLQSRSRADLRGSGILAVTSVTGASAEQFENTFANLMQRVTIERGEGTQGLVRTSTVLVANGGAFLVRTTFRTPDLGATREGLLEASIPAREYKAQQASGTGATGKVGGARLAQPALIPAARQNFPDIITQLLGTRRDEVARLAESYRTAPDAPAREAVAKQIAKVVDEINVLQHPSGKTDADLEIVGPDFFVDDFVRTADYPKYRKEIEDRMLAGEYVPQFIFAGAATRLLTDIEKILGRKVDPLPYRMYGLNIWDALRIVQSLPDADLLKVLKDQQSVDTLKQFRIPDKTQSYGLGPRQILAYKESLAWVAAERGVDFYEVLARQRLVLHINEEIADQVLQDFEDNDFYGFERSKVFFIVQPVFEGFELAADGSVNPAPASPALPFGHGYATTQLNYPGDAFTLAIDGAVVPVADSTLQTLIDADPNGRILTSAHRINDLTKVDADTIVDVDALALGLYLQVEKGYRYITHLVGNPTQQKGGNNGRYKGDTRSFLVETSNTNGSPVLTALINAAAQAGSPYNAFRNQSTPRTLKQLLDIGIRYNLRFKEGFFYLESVTGDLSQIPQSNTASIHRRGELIKDFKQLTNLAEALPFLAKQDNAVKAARLAEPVKLSPELKDFLRSKRFISVVAAPFAGKGTHLKFLEDELNEGFTAPEDRYVRLETGDFFRGAFLFSTGKLVPASANYEEYKAVAELINTQFPDDFQLMLQGKLISNEAAEAAVNLVLAFPRFRQARGILLDGYPRALPQLEAVDEGRILVGNDALKIDLFLVFDVPKDTLRRRAQIAAGRVGRVDADKTEERLTTFENVTLPVIGRLKADFPNTIVVNSDDKPGTLEESIQAVRREELIPALEARRQAEQAPKDGMASSSSAATQAARLAAATPPLSVDELRTVALNIATGLSLRPNAAPVVYHVLFTPAGVAVPVAPTSTLAQLRFSPQGPGAQLRVEASQIALGGLADAALAVAQKPATFGGIVPRAEIQRQRELVQKEALSKRPEPVAAARLSATPQGFDAVSEFDELLRGASSSLSRGILFWQKGQGSNHWNALYRRLDEAIVGTTPGSIVSIAFPLEAFFDPASGKIISVDFKEMIGMLNAMGRARRVRFEIALTYRGEPLAAPADALVRSTLERLAGEDVTNPVGLSTLRLAEDQSVLSGVVNLSRSKNNDQVATLGPVIIGAHSRDIQRPQTVLEAGLIDSLKDQGFNAKVGVFGVQVSEDAEHVVPAASLFSAGIKAISPDMPIPSAFSVYFKEQNIPGLGNIIIVQAIRIDQELRVLLISIQATQSAA